MELLPDEIEEIEQAVDAAFLKLHGKTYRHATVTDGEQNGSASKEPDSLEKIKRDFPGLFGGAP